MRTSPSKENGTSTMGDSEPPLIADARWAIVGILPTVLEQMFAPGEVDSVHIANRSGLLVLSLEACGESADFYVRGTDWAHESDREVQARLASQIQDFIAESFFARGQLRPLPPDLSSSAKRPGE